MRALSLTPVMKIFSLVTFFVSTVLPANLLADWNNSQEQPVSATLEIASESVSPGETIKPTIKFSIPKPWHIYWKEPGDAGLPTKITYSVPEGFQPGEIEWPPHLTFVQPGNITGYGYEEDIALPTPIKVADNAIVGDTAQIKAQVRWLACSDRCIPGSATLVKTVKISAQK